MIHLYFLIDEKWLTWIIPVILKKESVEEQRFVREREREVLEAKKMGEAAQSNISMAQQAAEAEATRKAALDHTFQEVIHILHKTGDKVSAKGLENLAKWKMSFWKVWTSLNLIVEF